MKQSIQEAVCSKVTINMQCKGALEVVVLSACTVVINLTIVRHISYVIIIFLYKGLESRLKKKKSEICNLRGQLPVYYPLCTSY